MYPGPPPEGAHLKRESINRPQFWRGARKARAGHG